jgi:hypothetical protein
MAGNKSAKPAVVRLIKNLHAMRLLTVDSATAASQNGFCSYKLSIHKKTNIMQIMTKNNFLLFI